MFEIDVPELQSSLENRRSSLDPARKVCEHCPQENLSSMQSQRAPRTVLHSQAILKAFGVVV